MSTSVTTVTTLSGGGVSAPVYSTGTALSDGTSNMGPPLASGSIDSPINLPVTVSKLQWMFWQANQAVRVRCGGTNAIQNLAMGAVSAGTTIISFGGQSTTAIPYNATATVVQAALRALSTIGANSVVCGGGPWPGTPITATFTYTLGGQVVTLMTNVDTLTGGVLTITTTTTGIASTNVFSLNPGRAIDWQLQDNYYACPLTANVTTVYVTNLSGVTVSLNLLNGVNV
jgi:hypothetical protein